MNALEARTFQFFVKVLFDRKETNAQITLQYFRYIASLSLDCQEWLVSPHHYDLTHYHFLFKHFWNCISYFHKVVLKNKY